MADNVSKYGFRLYRGGFQDTGAPLVVRYPVASNYDSNQTNAVGTAGVGFRPGDLVNLLTDGTVKHCRPGNGTDATTPPQSFAILAVVVGIEPWFDSSIGQTGAMRRADNLPAGVVYGTNLERQSNLLVVPAEGNVFEVDADDNVTATTQAAYQAFVGENADFNYTAVAPKAFPRLDISTHIAATALQWRIVGISPSLENQDFSGANVKLLVTVNIPQAAPFLQIGI